MKRGGANGAANEPVHFLPSMISFNIASFSDSTNTHGFARDTLVAALAAVGKILSDLIASPNATPVDLQVNVLTSTGSAAASAGPASVSPTKFDFSGLNVVRNVVAERITTGVDINGATADGTLNIFSSFIDGLGLNWTSTPVANGIVSVLLHEVTHAMGLSGYRDKTTGAYTPVAGVSYQFASTYDTFVTLQNGSPVFTGATATQVYGAPVPLAPLGTASSISHISPLANTGAGVGRDLMDPSANLIVGPVWTESDTDLAILRDLGYTLNKTLVSRDGHTFFVGAGRQTVVGTATADTAVFANSRSDFTVSTTAGGITLTSKTSPSDSATLTSVERLRFSNTSVALDAGVGDSGGKAVLLLGAVLGQSALVAKAPLVGTVIGLFDQGFSLRDLSGAIMRLDIWGTLANGGGASASNTQIANYLLTTVNRTGPDATTLASGVSSLNSDPQGDFLWHLAESAANQAQVGLVGLAATGIVYG